MRRLQDARERLIASATELIHARSYGAVSVDDLCAHAGVHKGSFYHFFPSKRDLLLAALDLQWEQARETMLEPAFAPDVPPLERIARFFTLFSDPHVTDPAGTGCVLGCSFGNLAAEMGAQDPVIRAKVQNVFAGICGYLEGALREAAAEGAITGVDAPAGARALLAYYEGIMLVAKAANNAALIDQLGHAALQILSQVGIVGVATAPSGIV
jgi:TetR/AcrR family transcriptional regulator, transcriptional repressor for nem operon